MDELVKESQTISITNLSSVLKGFEIKKFRIPKLPSSVFTVQYKENDNVELEIKEFTPTNTYPSQASPLTKVELIKARKLTQGENVKNTLELTFKFKESNVAYLPGDSFGFLCSNSLTEVNYLLERLDVLKFADLHLDFKLHKENAGNKKKLLAHIPNHLTLRQIFLHCVEIRSVPKKILLRIMAEYALNEKERDLLLFLSSVDGSKFYTDYIRKPILSILDILWNFPSCSPPVEVVLEYLPSLKPRFYSVASSPLEEPSTFKIIFNVIEFTKEEGRRMDRQGVCTGWLNRLSSKLLAKQAFEDESLDDKLAKLDLNSQQLDILTYKRQNNNFSFPENLNCPVIMVGPGTGVAPFIGYLQHREKQGMTSNSYEIWLFYGCRYKKQDYLYRDELLRLKAKGVLTHLMECFSRENSSDIQFRYVYESIRHCASDLVSAVNKGGQILVCGDAKNMAQDVQQAFIDIFQTASGLFIFILK